MLQLLRYYFEAYRYNKSHNLDCTISLNKVYEIKEQLKKEGIEIILYDDYYLIHQIN